MFSCLKSLFSWKGYPVGGEVLGERSRTLRLTRRCRTRRSQSSQRIGIQRDRGLSWRPLRPLRAALRFQSFVLCGRNPSCCAHGSKGIRAGCSLRRHRADYGGHAASAGSTSHDLSNVELPVVGFRMGVPPTGNGGPFALPRTRGGTPAGRLCLFWLEV